jgi:hypothetical protein
MKLPNLASQDWRSTNATLARKPAEVPYTTFDDIVSEVCRYMGVPQWTIYDTGRHPRTVAARQLIVALARHFTLLSFPQISVAMRRRSTGHSAAMTQLAGWKKRKTVNTPRGDVSPEVVFAELSRAIKERTAA